jgi:hypothetical protein
MGCGSSRKVSDGGASGTVAVPPRLVIKSVHCPGVGVIFVGFGNVEEHPYLMVVGESNEGASVALTCNDPFVMFVPGPGFESLEMLNGSLKDFPIQIAPRGDSDRQDQESCGAPVQQSGRHRP